MALATTSPIGRRGNDETASHLQRTFAQESSERDTVKLTLHRLKTAVDFYRQRLQGLMTRPAGPVSLGDEESLTHRVRDLIKDMESEVRSAINQTSMRSAGHATELLNSALSPASPQKGKSYEVLRQSLEEAQRRCESLNSDMVHQTEANEELVETLSTVKDANKRLLEQIRQQTTEISSLTQLRVADEEKMDQMTRKHEADREAIRQDTQRQMLMVRDAHVERHGQVYTLLTDKLRYVKARSELLQQDTLRLVQELQERKGDAMALQNAVQNHLQAGERDLATQCEAPKTRHEQLKQATEDNISALNLKLQAERQARADEGLSWGHKYGTIATEKEDVQARMTRELTQLSTHLQALQRTLSGERQSWLEERSGLERQVDEYFQQKNNRKMAVDQLQRDVVAHETTISSAKAAIESLEHVIVDLKSRARETDDALAAAVSGNEHLRDQMEEQRQRFQDKNETDLNDCRAASEQKIADERVAHEADVTMACKQVEAMEYDIRFQEEEVDKVKRQADVIADECTNFARENAMWRSQCESVKCGREASEKEYGEAKQVYQSQRLKLQAGIDQMTKDSEATGEEIKLMTVELHNLKRDATSRETETSTRQASIEIAYKDSKEMLAVLQQRLRDATDMRARVAGEAAAVKERMSDLHVALGRNLDGQVKLLDDERKRMQDHLDSERRAVDQVREEFNRERDMTQTQLKRVHDESRSKLAGVEKERARIHESSRAELTQASQVVTQLQAHVKALEHDLSRVQALCAESEANSAWVRQEHLSIDRDTSLSLRALEEEVRAITSSLDIARRDEAALSQQLDASKQRHEQERAQLRRTLDDLGSPPSPAARNAMIDPRTVLPSASGYSSWRPMTAR